MFAALGEKEQNLIKFALFTFLVIFLILTLFTKKLKIEGKVHFSAPFPPKAGNVALAQRFY